jgi:hypothetical protein
MAMPLRCCDGLRVSLRRFLSVVAVFGLIATATSPALAQQDREHEALVQALRMQQPSDPMWQAMSQIAYKISPDPTYDGTPRFVPPNAKAFFQLYNYMHWKNGWGWLPFTGIMLLSFEKPADASSYAASNAFNPEYDTRGSQWHAFHVVPQCRRIVGDRHVIELRGFGGCSLLLKRGASAMNAVFGVLVKQANEALSSLPPPTSDQPPASSAQPPSSANDPADTRLPEANIELPPDSTVDEIAVTIPELTPAEIAAAAGLAGGTALLGSLLMLGASGVRREEAIAAIRDLLRGHLPEDPYEAWKRKYAALGWEYSEKDGVGTFDPVEGARNEGGEVYSAARGGFVRSEAEAAIVPPRLPRDGDVNEQGEVWSDYSHGFVGRNTYEQDKASHAGLADKAKSDLADMQRPDAHVAELQRKIAETRQQGAEMRSYFKARGELLGALGEQRGREDIDALLDKSRSGLFDELSNRLLTTPADNDYRKGLEGLMPLADVIGNQMRDGYTPTYTYKDAAQDTLLQSGAAALDAVLTKGWASSTVGSGLAMRDAARAGTGDILAAGAKSAVTDFLFGKAIHYGAGYAGDAWRAGKKVVTGAADGTADLLAQASRRSKVATDLVEKMQKSLDTLDKGMRVDGSGRVRASMTDVLEVQKNPHQVRALKQGGSLSTQEAFNNTLRHEVYKPHDQMLLERLRKSSPELVDKKLVVHEFRTPGKTANPINTDRDFRVLMQDNTGKWVEVPRTKWEHHSNDAFAELTFFDKSKCPKGMDPAQQKAWWAEQHGHTPTDRAFREAGRDYSDQATDLLTGRKTQLDQPRIAELKDIASGKVPAPSQPIKLADPQALAQQFHEKVTGNLRRGDPFEAIAQAQKGVDTLDTVRKAYDTQNIPAGTLPGNLRQAMDLVKSSNLPVHPDAAVLHTLEGKLEGLGFTDIGDFSHKLSSQFEGLKWAQ